MNTFKMFIKCFWYFNIESWVKIFLAFNNLPFFRSASDRPIVRSFSQCNKTKDIMQIGPGKHSIRYELLTTPTPPATLQRSVSGQPFSELSNTKGISELLSTCDVTVDSLNAEMTETYLKTRADFFRDTNQANTK